MVGQLTFPDLLVHVFPAVIHDTTVSSSRRKELLWE